ncbi:hypothetical protein [Roseovarius salis]
MPDRSCEADKLIVRAMLRAARPEQLQRLLRDISDGGCPEPKREAQ